MLPYSTVYIRSVCSSDGIQELTVGSKDQLDWIVEVRNGGEDAHVANVWLTLPPGVGYRRTNIGSKPVSNEL